MECHAKTQEFGMGLPGSWQAAGLAMPGGGTGELDIPNGFGEDEFRVRRNELRDVEIGAEAEHPGPAICPRFHMYRLLRGAAIEGIDISFLHLHASGSCEHRESGEHRPPGPFSGYRISSMSFLALYFLVDGHLIRVRPIIRCDPEHKEWRQAIPMTRNVNDRIKEHHVPPALVERIGSSEDPVVCGPENSTKPPTPGSAFLAVGCIVRCAQRPGFSAQADRITRTRVPDVGCCSCLGGSCAVDQQGECGEQWGLDVHLFSDRTLLGEVDRTAWSLARALHSYHVLHGLMHMTAPGVLHARVELFERLLQSAPTRLLAEWAGMDLAVRIHIHETLAAA